MCLWVVGVGVMLIAAGQLPSPPSQHLPPSGEEELLPAHFLFKPYFVFSVSATRQHGGGAVVGDRMAKR